MTRLLSLRSGARRGRAGLVIGVTALAGLLCAMRISAGAQQANAPAAVRSVMPQYDGTRNLQLPADYREWVLVGSSLGLSYSEGTQGRPLFHATLMEPSAYRHFLDTGTFREGTMLALILQSVGTNTMPARQGQFGGDVVGVEMAVKDAARVTEGWAYYAFGNPSSGNLRAAASPQPKNQCFDCHDQHAARDHVFTQFYGLLRK